MEEKERLNIAENVLALENKGAFVDDAFVYFSLGKYSVAAARLALKKEFMNWGRRLHLLRIRRTNAVYH